MKARLEKNCTIKAVVWDNGGVLTSENCNDCYDLAYEKAGITPPLAGDPLRGKQYKKMLSVPIVPERNQHLETFVQGTEETNYLHSYSSSHISAEEFWPIACKYGFGLSPTDKNIDAIRTAQTYVVRKRNGEVRIFPDVIEILLHLAPILPQYMLSNTTPEIYEGLKIANFLRAIPKENRLFSIFIQCRKPSAESYETLINKTGCDPQEILFIDDKALNIETAGNHGINGIVFNGQKESANTLIDQLKNFGIILSP